MYLNVARHVLARGRTVLFLVPEISLTPSLEGLLSTRFKEDVAVLHSGLSDGERYDQWVRIARGGVRIVLGARSAVFAPLDHLGLIVVDEEHDGAYKQEDKLRYQARDLALWRGRHVKAAVVLGFGHPVRGKFSGCAVRTIRVVKTASTRGWRRAAPSGCCRPCGSPPGENARP